ncbi:hypothetical protein Bhyg_14682 [Pseudolycoriella hygida]|uniref:Uncharacterized protein n=1 Tax=Pseudolycoriella hygida TaxID=35572 RepID=A0A9Q0MQD6_9DIPT|nr:hypothetical protein Bhyg_14682 [Pseudolycoriella hygida]
MRLFIIAAVITFSIQGLSASPCDKCDKREEDNRKCSRQLEILQEEKYALQCEVDRWKQIAQEEKRKNEEYVNTINNLNKEQKRTRDQLNELQRAFDDRGKKLESCSAQLSCVEEEKRSLVARNKSLEAWNKSLEDANNVLKDKCDRDAKESADKIRRLEITIDDLRSKLEQKNKCSECYDELNRVKQSFNDLKEKHGKCAQENDRLNSEIKRLEDILRKKEQEGEESAKLITKLRLERDELNRDLTKCRRYAEELGSQINCLRNDLAEQAKACKKRIDELEEKLRKQEKEFQVTLDIERQKTLEEARRRVKAEELNADLRNQLRQKQQELDECIKDRKACSIKVDKLLRDISDSERERERLRKELENIQCRYNDLLKDFKLCQENSKKCQDQLNNCREELANARNIIKQLQRQIIELNNSLKKCNDELCSISHKLGDAKGVTDIISASVNKASSGITSLTKIIRDLFGSAKSGCNKNSDCGC